MTCQIVQKALVCSRRPVDEVDTRLGAAQEWTDLYDSDTGKRLLQDVEGYRCVDRSDWQYSLVVVIQKSSIMLLTTHVVIAIPVEHFYFRAVFLYVYMYSYLKTCSITVYQFAYTSRVVNPEQLTSIFPVKSVSTHRFERTALVIDFSLG